MNRIVKSERYDATQLNSVFFQWEFSRALNAFTLTQLSAAVRASGVARIFFGGAKCPGGLGTEVPQWGPGAKPRWGLGALPPEADGFTTKSTDF
jgi:hypothetical protein